MLWIGAGERACKPSIQLDQTQSGLARELRHLNRMEPAAAGGGRRGVGDTERIFMPFMPLVSTVMECTNRLVRVLRNLVTC